MVILGSLRSHLWLARRANFSHRKGDPGNLWARYVLRPTGNVAGAIALQFGIRPNTITLLSLVFGLAGAIALLSDNAILAIFLLFSGQVLDYADGTVARALQRTTAWGRFLDSQFGRLVDVSMWLAIFWVLLLGHAQEGNIVNFWVFFAVLVPILGLLSQSLKHQKRNYEHRMQSRNARRGGEDQKPEVLEANVAVSGKIDRQQLSVLGKLWRKRTFVSSVWETFAFPVLTLSLLVGALEIFVAGAFFSSLLNYGIRWLETIRGSDDMRSSSL